MSPYVHSVCKIAWTPKWMRIRLWLSHRVIAHHGSLMLYWPKFLVCGHDIHRSAVSLPHARTWAPEKNDSWSLFSEWDSIWVCLKIVYPEKPNGFADHYPVSKWLFHWGYTPFSDIPIFGFALGLDGYNYVMVRTCISWEIVSVCSCQPRMNKPGTLPNKVNEVIKVQ